MPSEILYLKVKQNVEITTEKVYLKDIAGLICKDDLICAKAKALKVYQFQKNPGKNDRRKIISVLKVIELLQEVCPGITVENLGETDTIMEYAVLKKKSNFVQALKIGFIALICFFGTGFTVMAFHNDIGITKVFLKVYELIMGVESNGYSILEVSYSIGLAIGILVFFNHIGSKRITKDPTPIEVEMRVYENDVNKALLDTAERENLTIDVK